MLWQRVRLQGLVRALHLHCQLGAVEEVGADRVTVRLLSGPLISVKPDNMTLLGLENSPSCSGCSRAVQPAGASASGAEVVVATHALGLSPFSSALMPVANARAVPIPPMAWDSADPVSF